MGLLTTAFKTVADWVEAGYPEEVAKRIVSGELPMDEASRAARAAEQGYGGVLYRGQPDRPLSSNQDIWASTSPDVAQTYADNFTVSHRDALGEDGIVVPLRTNATNMADVNARGRSWHVVESNNRKIPGIESGVLKGTDRISEAVRDSGKYDGTAFRNIPDDAVRLRGAELADSYNILGSRPDVNIRHADAAYDPQYTGPNIMGGLLAGGVGLGALGQSEEADAMPSLVLKGGIDAVLAAKQLRNKINKERGKGISGEKSVADFIHRNSNYEKGFIDRAKQWDKGLNGESYTIGINSMADELLASTDDPAVMDAIQSWRGSRLDSSRHSKYGRGAQVAAPAGLLSVGANATTPEERGFKSWEEVSRDPTAPLPPPTWGEAMGKAGENLMTVLDAPMSGIQGLTRTGYGLLTGEGLDAALNNGADVVNGGVDAGADRLGKWVTNATGDDTLGFYAKWGSLLGAPF